MRRVSYKKPMYNSIMRLYSTVIWVLLLPGHKCDLSVNVSSNFSDSCDYTKYNYPCGDICVGYVDYWLGKCTCGDQVIGGWDEWIPGSKILGSLTPKYCCTPPSVQCRKTLFGATCPEGEVLEAEHFYTVAVDKFDPTGTTPCNGRCYNDYVTSQFIAPYSHYTCPDKCVHWSAMCRGVSFCDGDEEMCGEHLRCPAGFKKYTMSTIPVRSYCFGQDSDLTQNNNHVYGDLDEDDGSYDNIDRNDEDINQSDETGRYNINYTALEYCTNWSLSNPASNGILCDVCIDVMNWCYEDAGYTAFCSDANVSTVDSILCSNHTFWQNISCSSWSLVDSPIPIIQGKRCTGTNQHCSYPWRKEGETMVPWFF